MRYVLNLALARPYRPRSDWMDYVNLGFGVCILAVIALAVGGALWRSHQRRKAEKHAALDRVRARKR